MSKTVRIVMIVVLLALLVSLTGCGRSVPPGHRGIYFNWKAGTEVENALTEGFHFLLPWNRIFLFDVRIQDSMESLTILSKDQLQIKTEISIRFRPDPEKIGFILTEISGNYYQTVIGPTLRSVAREVISGFSSIEAYTKRLEIQSAIEKKVRVILKEKNILIEAVLLRNMEFPNIVTNAIEQKIAMQQESEKMAYVLEKESKEADRKRIEAQGIADFQKIVSEGINQNLLRWKGIEATLKLAESQNSKVVVIGAGEDGLPLILGK